MVDRDASGRWERLKELFAEALEREGADRAAFLNQILQADPDLCHELSGLLAAHERADALIGETTIPAEAWTASAAPRPPEGSLPETIGRYEILSLLGAGGMGQVYLAHETVLDRDVALKVLPERRASRPRHREQLLREARAAACLNHPNITTIHEVGESDGRDYISFEYVPGQTLRDRLTDGCLELPELLSIAVPLADALAYAHERGVIHCDLKPANVMLSDRGVPKLLDFGLASRRAAVAPGDEEKAPIAGTPSAMSPEQVAGRVPDHRSDIFSFGSLLYEMATARPAFSGKDVSEILEAVRRDEPSSMSELRPELPKELAAIVERCLRKEPCERYQSMADVLSDLRQLVDTVPQAPRTRSRIAAWVLGGVSVVAIGVAIAVLGAQPASERQTAAVMGFENRDDPQDTSHVGAMLSRLVTTNLSMSSRLDVLNEQHLFDVARQMGHTELSADPASATLVARQAGADLMIIGSFSEANGQLQAQADVMDLEANRLLASLQVHGASQSDIFAMADSLGHQVRAALQEPEMSEDTRRALADQLTTSVEAYRAFVKGLEGLLKNQPREAADALREATALDPAFALAQFRLSMALIWTGEFEESTRAMQRTLAFRDKLPPDLRLAIDALGPVEEHATALPLLRQLIERDPYNHDALYQLGEIFTHSASRSDSAHAAETYERLLALDPGLSLVYEHLLTAYLRSGRMDDARAQLAQWEAMRPAPTNLALLQGTLALWEGRYDEAATKLASPLIPEFLGKGLETSSVQGVLSQDVQGIVEGLAHQHGAYLVLDLDFRADILVTAGRFNEAIELYRKASEVSGIVSGDGFHTSLRNGARHRLAAALVLLGDIEGAQAEAAAALALQPGSYRCLYMDALMALRAGDLEAAERRQATLAELASQALSPAATNYQQALSAEIALAEGLADEARAGFAALLAAGHLMEDWYVHEDSIEPLVRDGLARACKTLGDVAGAESAWAGVTEGGLERLRQPVPWVLSLYERGRLAIENGDDAGRNLLEKFLACWGGADPEPREVTEARALLGG